MAGKKDKSIIGLHYAALGDNAAQDGEIPLTLVKKAKGLLGRQAREGILRMMDSALRVQAAEVAQRQLNPMDLYRVGQEAVLEAIKLYQAEQHKTFRQFATAFARQSMVVAKHKTVSGATPLRPPPLRGELLGKKPPKHAPPPKPE